MLSLFLKLSQLLPLSFWFLSNFLVDIFTRPWPLGLFVCVHVCDLVLIYFCVPIYWGIRELGNKGIRGLGGLGEWGIGGLGDWGIGGLRELGDGGMWG